jgi:hypothetical protein
MSDFLEQNVTHPVGRTYYGNTNPRFRFSCIGTVNIATERLHNRKLWSNVTGLDEIDKTIDEMHRRGFTDGEVRIAASWSPLTGTTMQTSVWDTLIELANHDRGWSVFHGSVGGGWHSLILGLDNRDPALC